MCHVKTGLLPIGHDPEDLWPMGLSHFITRYTCFLKLLSEDSNFDMFCMWHELQPKPFSGQTSLKTLHRQTVASMKQHHASPWLFWTLNNTSGPPI